MSFISGSGGNVAVAPPGPIPAGPVQVHGPPGGQNMNNTGEVLAIWNAPADGNQHSFQVGLVVKVTAAQTGGVVSVQWTTGGIQQQANLDAGSHPSNGTFPSFMGEMCDSGSAVIVQATAVSAGTSIAFTTIWGA